MAQPNDKHEQYAEFEDVWQKCRDARAGQRAIRKGGETYLSKLAGQETKDYTKYLNRANFFNATGRTVDAMKGLVFRKPMAVNVPEAFAPYLKDVTLSNDTLTDFAAKCVEEAITVFRGGIFVDMPKTSTALTQAQAEAQQIRPYLVFYKTESILNWEMARVNNVYCFVNVWLSESYVNAKGDKDEQVRQLRLIEGVYSQVIWQKADNGEWFITDTIVPTRNSASITEIPFYIISADKSDVSIPAIESLADVNISHYQNSADLENGAHISGIPTPYVTGIDNGDTSPLYLGSTTILSFPNENTQVGFLQCGSEGFATLEKLMDRKEGQMAALGARMLAPEKKDAEASETHQIKRGGENSILSSICGIVETAIMKAFTFMAEWVGITGEISIELNRDFYPVTLTPQELTAWVAARQAGEISKETFFEFLKYSEVVADELTFEKEQERIASDGPALSEVK